MKKRLLLYTDCYTFSGSENIILNILSSEALKKEFEIVFIYRYSQSYAQKLKQIFEKNNLQVSEEVHLRRFSDLFYNSNLPSIIKKGFYKIDMFFDFFLLYFIFWIPFFIRVLKRLQPDIVHINNGGYPAATSCLAFAFAARICKVEKIIMHVNNLAFPRKWYDIKYQIIDSYLQKIVSYFITGSKAAATVLCQNRRIEKDRIVSINNTLLMDNLTGSLDQCFAVKPLGETWVGFVGLLTQRKGVSVLIKAASLLRRQMEKTNTKVILVGDGEEYLKLQQLVEEEGLQNMIVFVGFTSEVYKYLNQFDLFVLPSISNEDFPYVLLEAMLCRKPIISTRVAGIPEIVLNNHTGYVVQPGSVNELAEKIEFLIDNRDTCIQMGKNGFERYRSLFSYSATMEKFKGLYSSTYQG